MLIKYWFKHRKDVKISTEHLQGLSWDLVNLIYGHHYEVQRLLCCPADAGHAGVSRKRAYFVCIHKARCRQVHDVEKVYASLAKMVSQTLSTEPKDYIMAGQTDIELEVARIAQMKRRGSRGLKASCFLLNVACCPVRNVMNWSIGTYFEFICCFRFSWWSFLRPNLFFILSTCPFLVLLPGHS